ncbi:hypothetical protein NL108_008214, partial [Boleophthalmus pectinirostris]
MSGLNRDDTMLPLHSENHKQNILKKFEHLRASGLLCDVEIQVEDRRFKAHKTILAATSDYFYHLFTSQPQSSHTPLRMDDMAADMFSFVIDFIYTGHISIEEKHTEQLLVAATRLEVKGLTDKLAEAVSKSQNGQITVKLTPRKRGRPRKNVQRNEMNEEPEESFEEDRCDGESSNKLGQSCGDASEQQSKRQIKLPLKYKFYTLGQEETKKHEKVKRGRKRKYPNTEARCEQCEKVFKNHLFLKIHQRTHTGSTRCVFEEKHLVQYLFENMNKCVCVLGEKPFRCSVCGHGFTQKHSLIVHQRAHTGERPFVCSVCNKALCTKNSLQDHMKLHEDNKSFSCDKCDRTFTQKRQLKSHYRVHTDKSLPECAECHHKFLDTAQLKKHLRTHTGEKPFTCEICGKCFTTKSTLQTHIRIH